MKSYLLILFGVFAMAGTCFAGPSYVSSLADAQAKSKATGKPVLVTFYGKW